MPLIVNRLCIVGIILATGCAGTNPAPTLDDDDQGGKPGTSEEVYAEPVAGQSAEQGGTKEEDDNEPDFDSDVPSSMPLARTPPQPLEYFFNNPHLTAQGDSVLEAKLIQLISMAPPRSVVDLSFYGFSRSAPANAIVDAYKRGVDIHVVLDGKNKSSGSSGSTILKSGLPADRLTFCSKPGDNGACIGNHINHNKFALFSSLTDGSTNVVWQASANLTGGQLKVHNNAVLMRGDATLYAGYRKYFSDLQGHASSQPSGDYGVKVVGSIGKTYFSPFRTGDPVVNILDNVTCNANSRIRIAMAFFLGRGAVADKIVSLKRAGCDVEVLLNRGSDHLDPAVLSTLEGANVKVRRYNKGDSDQGVFIHSKYLLIDSKYGDAKVRQKLVFTGSHNYTSGALRDNDETLLRLDDAAAFAAFEADYTAMRPFTN
jgi:hypothetical protein